MRNRLSVGQSLRTRPAYYQRFDRLIVSTLSGYIGHHHVERRVFIEIFLLRSVGTPGCGAHSDARDHGGANNRAEAREILGNKAPGRA